MNPCVRDSTDVRATYGRRYRRAIRGDVLVISFLFSLYFRAPMDTQVEHIASEARLAWSEAVMAKHGD